MQKMQSLEQTAAELFQTASLQQLPFDEAVEVIQKHPGIIPVAITAAQQVVWLDVGDYQFKEWKFRYSIDNLISQHGIGKCFTTDIQLLAKTDATLSNNLIPRGFIFHMSKCGSTLISKALTQADNHLVINEATPLHENLWQYLTNDWRNPVDWTDNKLRLIRNLILTMGRRRLPDHDQYFVRFRSWNVAFADVIQRAFPDTPCLFMYRDPVEVLASILSKTTTSLPRLKETGAAAFITGVPSTELNDMDNLHYFTSFYKQYLHSSLTKMQSNTRYLNYRQLSKQNLAEILSQTFGYTTTETRLSLMQAQFDTYSKDDSSTISFKSDNREKQKLVTPAIRDAAEQQLMDSYRELEESNINLNKVLPQCATDNVTTMEKRHDF